jgi:hypothetical protein
MSYELIHEERILLRKGQISGFRWTVSVIAPIRSFPMTAKELQDKTGEEDVFCTYRFLSPYSISEERIYRPRGMSFYTETLTPRSRTFDSKEKAIEYGRWLNSIIWEEFLPDEEKKILGWS